MESRLQPLDFRAKYTKTEIETKALELNVSISKTRTIIVKKKTLFFQILT